MSFLTHCDGCSQQFSIPDDLVGSNVACPRCGTVYASPPRDESSDNDVRVHPLVWALIGGIVVAAFVLAIAILPGGRDEIDSIPDQPDTAAAAPDPVNPEAGTTAKALDGFSEIPRKSAPKESSAIGSVEDLYAEAAPAVVTISVKNGVGDTIGSGSGFFLSDRWIRDRYKTLHEDSFSLANKRPTRITYVLTNYHVIAAAVDAKITLSDETESVVWEVVTEDAQSDLALLCVLLFSRKVPATLPLAEDVPRVGAAVYAIGSPGGLANSLSEGVISGIRDTDSDEKRLQTTAPISPGSSGGPLLTSDGRVVGITTAFRTSGQNLNFAVPASRIRSFLQQPLRTRKLWRGTSRMKEEFAAFRSVITTISVNADEELLESGGDPIPPSRYLLGVKVAELNALKLLGQARRNFLEKQDKDAIRVATDAKQSLPAKFRYLADFVLGCAHFNLAHEEINSQRFQSMTDRRNAFSNNTHSEASTRALSLVTELEPAFSPGYHWLAWSHYYAGQFPEALIAADKRVRLVPRCAEAYELRARCFSELERYATAVKDFETAIEFDPAESSVYRHLASTYSSMREYDKAAEAHETSIAKGDSHPVRYFNLGYAYQKAKKYKRAIAAFEKASHISHQQKALNGGWYQLCRRRIAECKAHLR